MNTATIPATDSPTEAYAAIVAQCPEAIALVDHLLASIASRAANVGQVCALNGETWRTLADENGDRDWENQIRLAAVAEALGWVRNEIGVIPMQLGSAATKPAFSFPKGWDLVAPDAEEIEFCATEAERREEDQVNEGMNERRERAHT